MPRDAVAVTALTKNAKTNQPAGTAIAPANGANIPVTGDTRDLLVRVTNTFAGAKNVAFKAGASPPALHAGVGDLVLSVPASTGDILVPIESARFAQADGSINVDFETGMTGIISAVRVPRTV
jgi:hypothetical protein